MLVVRCGARVEKPRVGASRLLQHNVDPRTTWRSRTNL